MVLVQAWKRVVLERPDDFSGRAGRPEFWWFFLSHGFVLLVLAILSRTSPTFVIALAAYAIAMLVPALAVTVRRLHDTGRSGWWYLIALVPYAGAVFLLTVLAIAGEPVPNAHGLPADPLLPERLSPAR